MEYRKCVLAGVGGQGTILAAHILAEVALKSGLDVKVSEIHGMSQRGGSVSTVVVFGEDVSSMVCDPGCADYVVAFELLEGLRNLPMLKPHGSMVVSDEVIKPASVLTGRAELPKDMAGTLEQDGALVVPAVATAREAGSTKCSNVVLLGCLSELMDFPEGAWIESVSEHVPPKTVDMNVMAFKAGRAFASEHKGDLG